jgi:endonuclease/exonuclease/phosphatase family metal-dependent hydrolase
LYIFVLKLIIKIPIIVSFKAPFYLTAGRIKHPFCELRKLNSFLPKILAFVIPVFIYCCSPAQLTTLKVMTFNIRYNNPDDSIYNWDHRKAMVYGVVSKYQPDIAGIQEALHGQMNDLGNALKGYSWFGVGRDDGGEAGEYAAIFYKTGRFTKLDGSTFWLSLSPEVPGSKSWNTACTRIVTWMKMQDNQSGQIFYIFNTHFDHASEQARVESAFLLRKKILEICRDLPVIVTGDFNSTAKERAYKLLTDSSSNGFLRDSRTAAPDGSAEPNYSYIGFPFQPGEACLVDFIFTRNTPGWKVSKYHIIPDNNQGRYPSDHLPVIAEFETGK